MKKYQFIITISGAFIMSSLIMTGVLFNTGMTAKFILGGLWLIVGIGWLSKYFTSDIPYIDRIFTVSKKLHPGEDSKSNT